MPAIDDLIAGYQRFRQGYYKENRAHLVRLAREGQSPKTAIISCCDSRVEPSVILDCKPGDLFVIRNVANLVPPCENNESYHGTSAALEFAVNGLEVESIVVLGHSQCGGIKALIDNPQFDTQDSFISKWMNQLNQVKSQILENETCTSQDQRYHACEQQGISRSLDNLMTFPWVQSRVEQGRLQLHGWHYDLINAELSALVENSRRFEVIS